MLLIAGNLLSLSLAMSNLWRDKFAISSHADEQMNILYATVNIYIVGDCWWFILYPDDLHYGQSHTSDK